MNADKHFLRCHLIVILKAPKDEKILKFVGIYKNMPVILCVIYILSSLCL